MEWTAQRAAEEIAPQLDRVRLGLLGRARPQLGELAIRHGLDVGAAQTMGMLRNLMPDRTVTRGSLMQLFRYQPAVEVEGAIDSCLAAGVLEISQTQLLFSQSLREAECHGASFAGKDIDEEAKALRAARHLVKNNRWSVVSGNDDIRR